MQLRFFRVRLFAQILVQRGWGRGPLPSLKTATARTFKVRAVAFLLLIMSVTENPLIACKLFENHAWYERVLDQSNVASNISREHSSYAQEITYIGERCDSSSWAPSKIHLTHNQIHL